MAGFKISNDVGATVFALLSGLSALFLTAWIFGSGESSDTSAPKITPIPVSGVATDNSREIGAARKALAEESARRAELANELRGSKSDLGALKQENASLKAELKKRKAPASSKGDPDGKLADLRLELKAANDSNGELTTRIEGAASTKAKLDANIADLQAKLKALEGEKSALAVKLKASAESAGKMAGLSAALAALKLQFDAETKASKEAKSSALTLKQSAAKKEKSLLAQIASLKGAMAGDSSKLAAELKALQLSSADKEKTAAGEIKALKLASADMDKVATELKALKVSSTDKAKIATAQLVKFKEEVEALTKKLTTDTKACDAAKRNLMAEINKLNGELDDLKNGDKLKRAGDFPDLDLPMLVNDPLKLDTKMRPLFASLRGIKETVADRESTYETIIAQGNSNAKDVVQFNSGSSAVTAAERKELEAKLKGLTKGVKVLAVGYASIDGDAKSNHDLSSKRASSVAQEVARITGLSASDVQAVYFGQTKRFDEKLLTPNRVVEVWVTR